MSFERVRRNGASQGDPYSAARMGSGRLAEALEFAQCVRNQALQWHASQVPKIGLFHNRLHLKPRPVAAEERHYETLCAVIQGEMIRLTET